MTQGMLSGCSVCVVYPAGLWGSETGA